MLEEAGFSIRRIFHETFTLRYLDGSALLNHAFIRMAFLDGWKRFLKPGEESFVFARIEDRLNHLAKQQGSLALSVPAVYMEGFIR